MGLRRLLVPMSVPVLVAALGGVCGAGAESARTPGFGSGGKVVTLFDGAATGSAVVLQADGRIVVAGTVSRKVGANRSRQSFAVARYTSSGRLDPTFGIRGKAIVDIADRAAVYELALQRNGGLVVGGAACALAGDVERCDFALARFSRSGRLDRTFGKGGKVVPDIRALVAAGMRSPRGLGQSRAQMVSVQRDGKILVGGQCGLARFSRRGRLDAAFGDGGRRAIVLGQYHGCGNAMLAAPNGTVLATGGPFVLTRYTSSGTPDAAFGTSGAVRAKFSAEHETGSTALVADRGGRVVVAGWDEGGPVPGGFGLARFTSAGRMDSTFGAHGTVTTHIGSIGSESTANAVALQRDGKIVVAGVYEPAWVDASSDTNTRFAVARYLENGTLDSTFAKSSAAQRRGVAITAFGPKHHSASSAADIAIQPDGKIVVVGSSSRIVGRGANARAASQGFALVRYLPDGRLDS